MGFFKTARSQYNNRVVGNNPDRQGGDSLFVRSIKNPLNHYSGFDFTLDGFVYRQHRHPRVFASTISLAVTPFFYIIPHLPIQLPIRHRNNGFTLTQSSVKIFPFNFLCSLSSTFLHEFGHVVGFGGHANDGSVMDPYNVGNVGINETIQTMLPRLYELPVGTYIP